MRSYFFDLALQRGIARYLAKEIGNLVSEKRDIEFEERDFKLSDTAPFTWRRRHVQCDHTIFNYVAAFNDFESEFAQFLDSCSDIPRFAALAEHFTRFCVDYLSPSGALKRYYPDFVAVQERDDGSVVHWIIETKGRKFESLPHKEASVHDWCMRVSAQVDQKWRYVRVDQASFQPEIHADFKSLLNSIVEIWTQHA